MDSSQFGPVEVDVRMRDDGEVVVAHGPEDVTQADTLRSFLFGRHPLSGPLVDAVPFFVFDVKTADALPPTVALLADAFSHGLASPNVRAICKLPRWAGAPRWAVPAALHRAPNVAVVQCDFMPDTALNQSPASRGYAYWDDFGGSGWRTAEMLRRARLAGLRVILCSDEVYGRALDVEKAAHEWRGAYGILTDSPEVWAQHLGSSRS